MPTNLITVFIFCGSNRSVVWSKPKLQNKIKYPSLAYTSSENVNISQNTNLSVETVDSSHITASVSKYESKHPEILLPEFKSVLHTCFLISYKIWF